MNNKYLVGLENKLHGYHTRLKELHYSAPSFSMHKIIDDFDSALCSFDDNIMEDAISIFGEIEPGELSPKLPKELEIEELLCAIRADLADAKDELTEKLYTGIINEIDEFWHTVNKTIYLVRLSKKNS
jgi:DNA-binding ferritin-like protein